MYGMKALMQLSTKVFNFAIILIMTNKLKIGLFYSSLQQFLYRQSNSFLQQFLYRQQFEDKLNEFMFDL